MKIEFTLNGEQASAEIGSTDLLVNVIRGLGRTGTKEACGVGVCGVCTVMVNDVPVSSCIYLAACADGAEVLTVEGVTAIDRRLRECFVEQEGFQCGICTPGQVVATYALRRYEPQADEDHIREYMAGNLCRCTGYQSIVDSAKAYLDAE